MAISALKIISSEKYLKARFLEMYQSVPKSKRDGAGIDNISLHIFHNDLDNNVRKLRKALLSGKYIPNRLLPYFVPKPNGKERIICVPTVMDRLVQRSLLHYLNEKGYTLDNPISYGFVRGNGVRKAATKAISYRKKLGWVYKADISAFFDEVNRDQLKAIVNSKIKTRSLRKLISLFIDTEIQKTRAHAT